MAGLSMLFFVVVFGLEIWLLVWFIQTMNKIASSVSNIEKRLEEKENN